MFDDLRRGNTGGGRLIHDHKIALKNHDLIRNCPHDYKKTKFLRNT